MLCEKQMQHSNEQRLLPIGCLKGKIVKLTKIWILLSLVLTMLSIGATEGIACSCMEKSSICNAFGSAKAVFIGKVVEGSSVERMSDMLKAGTKDLTFTFRVSRGFYWCKR